MNKHGIPTPSAMAKMKSTADGELPWNANELLDPMPLVRLNLLLKVVREVGSVARTVGAVVVSEMVEVAGSDIRLMDIAKNGVQTIKRSLCVHKRARFRIMQDSKLGEAA